MKSVLLVILLLASLTSAKEIVLALDSPSDNISGLAWGNDALWAIDAETDSVFKLDPTTGEILSSFHTTNAASISSTGLAFSEEFNLLYCGGWHNTDGYVYKYKPDGTYDGMINMCGG